MDSFDYRRRTTFPREIFEKIVVNLYTMLKNKAPLAFTAYQIDTWSQEELWLWH